MRRTVYKKYKEATTRFSNDDGFGRRDRDSLSEEIAAAFLMNAIVVLGAVVFLYFALK